MSRKIFVGVLLFATLIIILVLCMAISPEGKETTTIKSLCEEKFIGDKDNKREEKTKENEKVAYLTFDDGPSKNTKKVLEILDRYKIKATFFIIGSSLTEEYIEQMKTMEKEGHSIGIHTFSHKYNQIYLSKDAYLKDFNKVNEVLCKNLKNNPRIYRFPGGSCNCFIGTEKKAIVEELKNKGYTYFDWNVSGEDSVNLPSVKSIVNNVLKDYKNFNKPIILLHDGPSNGNTVSALSTIIEDIKKSGYSFSTLR